MSRPAITHSTIARRHAVALLVTGLVALPLSQARAAGAAATPRQVATSVAAVPATSPGRVVDLGSLEGIVVTPHGTYSRSEWDAHQHRLAEQRTTRLAFHAPGPMPVSFVPADRARTADWQGVLATLPGLPAATMRAVTLSLPTPSAGI